LISHLTTQFTAIGRPGRFFLPDGQLGLGYFSAVNSWLQRTPAKSKQRL
jgi:hypothetical protein